MRFRLFVMSAVWTYFGFTTHLSAQLTLTRGSFTSEIKRMTTDSADKALKIATYLINSAEFKDSVAKLSFPWKNRCVRDSKEVVGGKEILAKIFGKPAVMLNLELDSVGKKPNFEKEKCKGLGITVPGSHHILSYYENIMCSMSDSLTFAWAYATHLTHEFLHDVGYCHTTKDVDSDVAEAIGEIAYYPIKHVLSLQG